MKPEYIPKDRNSRLFRLVEELGELQAAIGKAGRWGMESVNPELPPEAQETNAEWNKRFISGSYTRSTFVCMPVKKDRTP